ncbi:hypothetical protein HIM_03312 [Hirsutella minnesotensis 3608]|uniref:Uncharacterized protein n=1 Tax=Hirsutella minnesotensis 3608 TaxID=1043627 RepID=A0A0F7ZM53_9HYPO|nr:hypothetical protein HIM_03312 [Hirsutella minnesotensis 3608]
MLSSKSDKTSSPPLPVFFPRSQPPRQAWNWRRPLGRALFATFAYFMCYQIYCAVVVDPLNNWVEDELSTMSEADRKKVQQLPDEDTGRFFLPWPIGVKQVVQPPYAPSDLEYQFYLAIIQSQEAQDNIKNILLTIMVNKFQATPQYVKVLGGPDITVSDCDLEIGIPSNPPDKYYVSGFWLGDEGIYWGDRLIDERSAVLMRVALWPKAVALGAWTFINSLTKQLAQDFVGKLRPKSSAPAPAPDTVPPSGLLAELQRQQTTGTSTDDTGKLLEGSNAPNAAEAKAPVRGFFKQHPRLNAAANEGVQVFAKQWIPGKSFNFRGIVRVKGVVEIQGKSALVVLNVTSIFDPQLNRYTDIRLRVQRIVHYKRA